MHWRKGYGGASASGILKLLMRGRRISDGKVSFLNADPNEWIGLVLTAIDFGQEKSNYQKRAIVKGAIFSEKLNSDCSPDEFLRELKSKNGEYRRGGMKKYSTIFPVDNISGYPRIRKDFLDCTITVNPRKTSRFFEKAMRERKVFMNEGKFDPPSRDAIHSNTTYVLVTCRANHFMEAFEFSERCLGVFLGLVNIFRNRSNYYKSGDKAFNEAIWAPFATVHSESGGLAGDFYWYDDWVPPMRKLRSDRREEIEFLNGMISDIGISPWKGRAFDAAFRYYEAFSRPKKEEAFLSGWRLLEAIGGDSGASYDELRSRASFFWREVSEMNLIGLHLKERRNGISHGRRIEINDDDYLASQMNRFLMPLLTAYLRNTFKVSSVNEFWSVISCPTDSIVLREKLKIYETALKFRDT